MIVTLTANPSIDRTAHLPCELRRGEVHRLGPASNEPGGKGINVARAVHLAEADVVAVLPAPLEDPLLAALREIGLPHRVVSVPHPVRTNLAVTEPDGTTTKLNEPGATLTAADADRLGALLLDASAGARWVALSGALPPGAPDDWYAQIVRTLRAARGRTVKLAIDAAGAPLRAVLASVEALTPDLLTPNTEELAEATGADPRAWSEAAAAGDIAPVADASRRLVDAGAGAVLTTLGAAGALLADRHGTWYAPAPTVTVRSTVAAGDSALAGYLLADVAGLAPAECLARAVAYGSAAAALPGSGVPTPAQAATLGVDVEEVTP